MKKPTYNFWLGQKRILVLGIIIFSVSAIFAAGFYLVKLKQPGIHVSDAMLAYDASNPRAAAGFFSDIFVGRVVEKMGTEKQDGIVMTIYTVEVIRALKGDALGTVTVKQQGGYYKGEWTVIRGDVGGRTATPDAKLIAGYLLEPGKVYIFSTLHRAGDRVYVIGSTATARTPIDMDAAMSADAMRQEIGNDVRVKAAEDAIAHQIAPKYPFER